MKKTKKVLNEKRSCTGGLLFMTCSFIIAIMLTMCTGFARNAMVRSVAESVEHTLALECLASCYTNPQDNPVSDDHGGGSATTFAPLTYGKGVSNFDPLARFNETMTQLNLMTVPSDGFRWEYQKYNENTDEGYTKGQATFKLQMNQFTGWNAWWTGTIGPKTVNCVIEKSYSARDDAKA